MLIARIHEQSPTTIVTVVNATTLKITAPNGTVGTLAVENALADYAAHPEQREDVLTKWVQIIVSAGAAPGGTAEQLVVVVRPIALRDVPGLGPTLVQRPLAGDLIQIVGFDSPDSLRWVNPADLSRLKMSEEELFARARINLKARIGPVGIGKVAGEEDGLSAVGAASGLATGLLADGSSCGATAKKGFGGGLHVLVLDRNSYAFAVDDDPLGMAAFRRFASKHAAAGDLASRVALRCFDGGWVVDR